jgi:hypothetical protein
VRSVGLNQEDRAVDVAQGLGHCVLRGSKGHVGGTGNSRGSLQQMTKVSFVDSVSQAVSQSVCWFASNNDTGELIPAKKFVTWFSFCSRHRSSQSVVTRVWCRYNENSACEEVVQRIRQQSNGPTG